MMFIRLGHGGLLNTAHVVLIHGDKVHLSDGSLVRLEHDELEQVEEIIGVYEHQIDPLDLLELARKERVGSSVVPSFDRTPPQQARKHKRKEHK